MEQTREAFESELRLSAAEKVLGVVFASEDALKDYMTESGLVPAGQEVSSEKLQELKKELSHALEVNPRFGSEDDIADRLVLEFDSLGESERVAMLQGYASLRLNGGRDAVRELNARVLDKESRPATQDVTFDSKDDALVRGYVLRSVLDQNVIESGVSSTFQFVSRYGKVTQRDLLADMVPDIERMLNESSNTSALGDVETELQRAGYAIRRETDAEGKTIKRISRKD